MEKKNGFMSFMKKFISKEKEVTNEDVSLEVATELPANSPIDPEKPFYAMLLVNSYLQFLFVFDRVTNQDDESSSIREMVPIAIKKLAVIVKEFESRLKLEDAELNQLEESLHLIEQEMKNYFTFKEQVESLEGKLKVLAPMVYAEKYQIEGLVRSGELFNPDSCEQYMQSIPKISSRIKFVNLMVHKLESNEPLEQVNTEEINKWFKSAINFESVVESDISTAKEIFLDSRR